LRLFLALIDPHRRSSYRTVSASFELTLAKVALLLALAFVPQTVHVAAAVAAGPNGLARAVAQVQGPIEIDDRKDAIDLVVGLAQVLGALVALTTLLFLLLQVRAAKEQIGLLNAQTEQAREEARIERSLSFQERFTGREFRTSGSLFMAFLDVDDARDAVEKIEAWQLAAHAEENALPRSPRDSAAPSPSKNDILQVLDFFEALGTAFNSKQIAQDALMKSFGSTPVQLYNEAWWFLCWRRRGRPTDETELYREFDRLVRRIRHEDPDLARYRPNAGVRLLAYPHGDDRWDWDVCAEFSDLMSRRLVEHPGLTLGHVVGDALCCAASLPRDEEAALFADVIAVPPEVAPSFEDWRDQREAATRLRERLRGLDSVGLEAAMRNLERYWTRLDAG
jgi:hypothetical protein